MELGLGVVVSDLFLGLRLAFLGVGLFHPETLNGTDHTDDATGPPGEHGIVALETLGVEETGDCRSESTAQTGGGGSHAVDGTEHFVRGSGVGEENGGCGEGHDMEGDLADQCNVGGSHLDLCGEKDEIRHDQVERRPDAEDEAERSEGAKVSHDKWEEPKLGDHGIHPLDSEHETDGLGLETQAASKLEGEGNIVVGFGCAEEDGHQLVERNTVAVGVISEAVRNSWVPKDGHLLCKNSVGDDVENDLLGESLGCLLLLELSLDVVIVGHDRAQAGSGLVAAVLRWGHVKVVLVVGDILLL